MTTVRPSVWGKGNGAPYASARARGSAPGMGGSRNAAVRTARADRGSLSTSSHMMTRSRAEIVAYRQLNSVNYAARRGLRPVSGVPLGFRSLRGVDAAFAHERLHAYLKLLDLYRDPLTVVTR